MYTLMLLKNGIEINTYTDEDIDTCENTEVWVLEVGDMGPGNALHRSVPKGPVCGIFGIPYKVANISGFFLIPHTGPLILPLGLIYCKKLLEFHLFHPLRPQKMIDFKFEI